MKREIERLMLEISAKPVQTFPVFNAVIVNLDALSPEKKKKCF